MDNKFQPIKPTDITDNTFSLIGKDWMLITAGTPGSYNTMTASWGGVGVLWNRNVCFIFVRPTRYTYEFLEKNDPFSLSFFTDEWKKALSFCGSKSGRDVDKARETGLRPFAGKNKTTGFEQARLVIECKKLYYHDFDPDRFLDPSIEENYSKNDYHRMYVGEILSVNVKK